jgi:hypothetical protein
VHWTMVLTPSTGVCPTDLHSVSDQHSTVAVAALCTPQAAATGNQDWQHELPHSV